VLGHEREGEMEPKRENKDRWVVLRDDEIVKWCQSYWDAFHTIHLMQSQSVWWATTYEGWEIAHLAVVR
jgi:hypothetical protein